MAEMIVRIQSRSRRVVHIELLLCRNCFYIFLVTVCTFFLFSHLIHLHGDRHCICLLIFVIIHMQALLI
jgi:hypothetical protein